MAKVVGTFLQIVGFVVSFWYPPVGMAIMAAGSLITAQAQKKEMERRARDAWNASVEDRNVIVRSGVAPAQMILGEANTGGVLVHAQSTGQYQENLALVVAVAKHQIHSFTHVYLDNEDIFPLSNGNEAKLDGRYNKAVGMQLQLGRRVSVGLNGLVQLEDYPTSIVGVFQDSSSVVSYMVPSGTPISYTFTKGNNFVYVDSSYQGEYVIVWFTLGEPTGSNPSVWCDTFTGAPSQTAWSWLVSNSNGQWASTAVGNKVAYMGLRLKYDENLFPVGIPPIKIVAKGALCYDPRKDSTRAGGSGTHRLNDENTWEWSDNPAICAGWYMVSPLGMKLTEDEIDWSLLSAAANICDEDVQFSTWTTIITQKRYRCNTVLSTEANKIENLEIILSSMAGSWSYSQGKMRIFAGAYSTPVMTIDETYLADGEIVVSSRGTKDTIFNQVKGVYFEPEKGWMSTDFPPVSVEASEVLPRDIVLPATTNGYMAQRLAVITLQEGMQSTAISANFNMKAYRLQPGDFVYLSLSRYGWNTKPFRVYEREFTFYQGIKLALKEADPTAWDPNLVARSWDAAPNTSLPSPYYVPTITGLTASSDTAKLMQTADGTIISRILVTWNPNLEPQLAGIEVQYSHAIEATWISLPAITPTDTQVFLSPVIEGHTYFIRLRSVNGMGAKSPWSSISHVVVGKSAAPSTPTGFNAQASPYGAVVLKWNEILDLDRDMYEVRVGSDWNTAQVLERVYGTTAIHYPSSSGTITYLLKALDTSGNYSTAAASTSISIVLPGVTSLAAVFSGPDLVLTWGPVPGSFQAAEYEIRYGATWAGSSTTAKRVKATTYRVKAEWTGDRTWWVAAVDVNGNYGTEAPLTVTINLLAAPSNFRADVVDNNVLLYWSPPSPNPLPVDRYEVRKGATWGEATVIGSNADSTFAVVFETQAGDYTYWVGAYDSGGTLGQVASLAVSVKTPPDFRLLSATLSTWSGTKSQAIVENGTLLLPFNTTETWATHFTNNSKTTIQGFIDHPYTYYFEPVPGGGGYYEEVVDVMNGQAGSVAQALIRLNYVVLESFLSPSIVVNLQVSNVSATGPWTDLGNAQEALGTSFRWVKYKVTATGGVVRLGPTTLLVSLKQRDGAGRIQALSTDSGGTTVYLTDDGTSTGNKIFLDVESITVTAEYPSGGSNLPWIPLYDFTDVPSPLSFKVLLYDRLGNRVTGYVRWAARGV